MKKKIFIFMLAIISTLCLALGITACSSDNDPESKSYESTVTVDKITYTLRNNTYTVTSADKDITSAVILSEYDGLPVTSIGDRAFYLCTSLESTTIPDSVTSIGSNAFLSCNSLTSITIPDSVTFIGTGAFACNSINYNYYENGYYLGNDSNKYMVLVSIKNDTVSKFTINPNTKIIYSNAFYRCSLESITIPDSVISIGDGAFNLCTSLESITMSDNIISIGYYVFNRTAFYNDKNNWEDNALYIGKYLIEADTSISGEYSIIDSTTVIASYAFSGCSSLTSISIPDSVTSIGSYAFAHCTSLTNVTIPDSVTSIGEGVFYNCTLLANLTVNPGNTTYKSIDGNLYNYNGTELIQYAIGKTDTSFTIPSEVTSIDSYAFYNCTSLESITMSDNIISIGEWAFGNCTSLASITIPKNVTSIGGAAFYNCTSLASITIPKNVTSIGVNAFYGCTSLTSVTIPDSVTSIGFGAFSSCSSLTSVTFTNKNGWYVTETEGDTSGTDIDVTDDSTNVTYFNNTYIEYYWYRSEG